MEESRDLATREERLLTIVGREVQSQDAGELIDAATLAHRRQLHVRACELYGEAFEARPGLLADTVEQHRYAAACAAAAAGCGVGNDATTASASRRRSLRDSALAWLRADLDVWNAVQDQESAVRAVQDWPRERDLAGVREDAKPSMLEEDEREAWKSLWADVSVLLSRSR